MTDWGSWAWGFLMGVAFSFTIVRLWVFWLQDLQLTGKCVQAPYGWWCSRPVNHDGPCAARPKWWNLVAVWRFR